MGIALFDAHCDTASVIWDNRCSLYENDCRIDLKRGQNFEKYAQFFAIWDMKRTGVGSLYERFLEKYKYLSTQIEQHGNVALCKTANDAKSANACGKIAAFISVEGAELLDCDIEKLKKAYEMGARGITLTWNPENKIAHGCESEKLFGLTEYGREFVAWAHTLGMLVDISHIGETGFWDVCELTGRPVMASHSNSKTLCDHKRNLTDAQFEAIIALNGFVGVTLYSYFLTGTEKSKISDVMRHIEYFLALGGERHIGIGTDFDGCESHPYGINGLLDLEKLYNAMLRANYKESLVRDIFYNNLMRIVEDVCGI